MQNTEPTTPSPTPGAQDHNIMLNRNEALTIAPNWWRLRQVEARAERFIAMTFGLQISGQEATRILAYHLEKGEKKKRGPVKVASASGARRKWKRRIMSGINEAISAQALRTESDGRGRTVSLTERALQIERAYNERFDELLAEFNPKRQ